MNDYYKISTDEFERVVDDYDGDRVRVAGTKEYVYDLPTEKDGIVVRLFSTLTRRDGGAREAGRDAIRTLAWSRAADAAIAQATRTHRIDTWEQNLRAKIDAMIARINDGEFDDVAPDATLAGLVPADRDEDAVIVDEIVDSPYGRKAVLDSPYDAKDAIKALEWDETHRSWDPERSAWTVDASALPAVAESLRDDGWPLRSPPLPDPDEFRVGDVDVSVGDRVTVTYEKKGSGDEATKSGAVVGVDDRITFERDDGHTMYVTDDGLFTARSAYPYVGNVVDVSVA